MNEWLSRRADALAEAAQLDRNTLELESRDVATLLDLAGDAAHASGARTNAPLLCYLLGLSRGAGKGLEELAEIVRSTS
ncbi:MAG: hypothetical protein V7644_969 [Actinomycetota bacterium]